MADFDFSTLTEGLANLTEGYIDYAEEVIKNRALPDLRDGLKPVNRRTLYTFWKRYKRTDWVKSQTVVGEVLKLHPHGDSSVYQALVLMVDRNGTMSIPTFRGQGNFGGVHTTDPAAASRYTEVSLSENAECYFGEMNGINIVPNYDSKEVEPALLPVSYPAVLCNSTSGIAVGFRSNIPSFNFNDVIDLTLEYIRDGKCSTVICPDFVTGGYYIRNNKELDKLMKTGLAKLKLRGKVTITGKEITVVEFPFGKTIQGLQSQIQDANIAGVHDVGNVDDYEHGVGLLVACTAKNRVNDVLLALYRDTDLQCTFSADLMTVLDGKPIRLGVWGVIEKWVEWRRSVLIKEYETAIEAWKEEAKAPRAFMEVIKDKDKVKEFTRLALEESGDAAVKYLLDNFDNEIVTPDLAQWILKRRLSDFRTGGKYQQKYDTLMENIKLYEGYVQDIDSVIYKQLETLKATMGSKYPRRTEITSTDYDFQVSSDGEAVKDDTECTYVFKDGFLKKFRTYLNVDTSAQYTFTASASDTLIAVDNRGRVLRVYCEDIPYCGASEYGIYLPRYFNLNESDDYRIWWISPLTDETKMILYTDGNVGFLDMSEWYGLGRRVRVIENGISAAVADKVGAVIDIPEYLFVLDNTGKLGQVNVSTIRRKDRTARTRVFSLKKDEYISQYACLSASDACLIVSNLSRYSAPKLKYLENASDWRGGDIFKAMM